MRRAQIRIFVFCPTRSEAHISGEKKKSRDRRNCFPRLFSERKHEFENSWLDIFSLCGVCGREVVVVNLEEEKNLRRRRAQKIENDDDAAKTRSSLPPCVPIMHGCIFGKLQK